MKIAIAVTATGEYWKGAKVLFSTLRKYGRLPDSVDTLAIGVNECDWATPVEIVADYSWVPVESATFPKVADKFFAWTLDYDRIIIIDADVMCVGDCSYLWSNHIGRLPVYACRDTAAIWYYPSQIEAIGLDHASIFNTGVVVVHPGLFPRRSPLGGLRRGIESWHLNSYDGSDQGYLNAYFRNTEIGWLPPEYNVCLDPNMPSLPAYAERLIHFCGGDANPWRVNVTDWRAPYYDRWRAEYDAP
ncbi:MAG: glycosyltransferase [Clostridia bacterium]